MKRNIVFINTWARFDDPRRWDNEGARFEDFIDHSANNVSYIVNEKGRLGIRAPENMIAAIVQVADISNVAELEQAFLEVMRRTGPIDEIIAVSEFAIFEAAKLREKYGIAGKTSADISKVRNKMIMKHHVQLAGLRVPRNAHLRNTGEVEKLMDEIEFPLIAKPLDGAASRGVQLLRSRDELAQLIETTDITNYEVEEYIDGHIHHVDGLVGADGRIRAAFAFKYFNNCLGFTQGIPFGSVVLDDPSVIARFTEYAQKVVTALGMSSTAFHLEFFVTAQNELVFLEIAGRPGGADVPYIIQKCFDTNINEHCFDLVQGRDIPQRGVCLPQGAGAYLSFPKPTSAKFRVKKVKDLSLHVPAIYRSLIPEVGQVLSGDSFYDDVLPGRYLLHAASTQDIDAALVQAVEAYEFDFEIVESPGK